MTDFSTIIRSGIEVLESSGFEVELSEFEPASPIELDAFEASLGLSLPDGLRQILSQTNGFAIDWISEDEEGVFLFPSLEELCDFRRFWVSREIPNWQAELGSSGSGTLSVLNQIQQWLPFEDHFNGDFYCVDCHDGRVYFASHDQIGKLFMIADDIIGYLADRAANGFID